MDEIEKHQMTQFEQGYLRACSVARDVRPAGWTLEAWLDARGNRPTPGESSAFRDGYRLRVEEAMGE
jgi:hypothetical protein